MLSCGMADMIATSASGRNYKVGATFVPLLAFAHSQRYGVNVTISKSGRRKVEDSSGEGSENGNDNLTSERSRHAASVAAQCGSGQGCTTDAGSDLSKLSPVEWKHYIQSLWATVDDMVCSGQKPQGVWTCEQVVECIHRKYNHDTQLVFQRYPLFSRIYEVVVQGDLPTKLFHWK